MEHPSELSVVDVMNMQSCLDKLNKMSTCQIEHISLTTCSFILIFILIFIGYTKRQFTLKKAIFLKNLNSLTFETKMPYYAEYDIRVIWRFLSQTKRVIIKGRRVPDIPKKYTLHLHSSIFFVGPKLFNHHNVIVGSVLKDQQQHLQLYNPTMLLDLQ